MVLGLLVNSRVWRSPCAEPTDYGTRNLDKIHNDKLPSGVSVWPADQPIVVEGQLTAIHFIQCLSESDKDALKGFCKLYDALLNNPLEHPEALREDDVA